MRKRPLCFFSIALVLIMWILQTSGERLVSSDVFYPKEEEVLLYGTVYRCEYTSGKQILYLKQAVLSVPSQKQQLDHIKITLDHAVFVYRVSDLVRVNGRLQIIKEAANPGQFDARSYYRAQKVGYTMWNPHLELLERPNFSFLRMLDTIQQRLAAQYDRLLPNQYGALLKGITLGDKNEISEEINTLFQKGGISHILAISALHLQLLGNSLYLFLRKCKVSIGISGICAGALLVSYGILTGANVATLRALIMFLFNIGADITGRTYDGRTAMAAAAVVLVAGNPDYLSYSGFWLSFFAVCSFLLFREKRRLGSGVLLYIFMAPVMLLYFYELPLYSVFINLLVVPTIGFVLLFGFFGCVGSFLHLMIGKIMILPSVALLHVYHTLCEISEKLPGNTMTFGKPSWIQVAAYYAIMALCLYLFRKNRLKKSRGLLLFMMVPAWMILIWRGIDGIQITMLDVGQGDCILVQTETEHTYMIDCGSSTENDIGKYRIIPYLKHQGMLHLDAVFLSHEDKDHKNGIEELFDMIKAGTVSMSVDRLVLPYWEDMTVFEELIEKASSCGVDVCVMRKGDMIVDGDMTIRCVHPDGGYYSDAGNEGSLVLRLEYGEFSMLFTGDLEGETEDGLLGSFGSADVLKVAHHGSAYSTSNDFLEEVQPKICIISCGEDNSYGHPHMELLKRLEDSGSRIFVTEKHGAITIRTDGEKIDLKTYKQYNSAKGG